MRKDDFDHQDGKLTADLTRQLPEACRRQPQKIRFVFSSSLAVYGGTLRRNASPIPALTPRSSYGAQEGRTVNCWSTTIPARKAMWMGWRCVLPPTICVRPGKPNRAASSLSARLFVNRCGARRPSARCRKFAAVSSPATVIHANSVAGATLPARRGEQHQHTTGSA